jgi:hypothetical protein
MKRESDPDERTIWPFNLPQLTRLLRAPAARAHRRPRMALMAEDDAHLDEVRADDPSDRAVRLIHPGTRRAVVNGSGQQTSVVL